MFCKPTVSASVCVDVCFLFWSQRDVCLLFVPGREKSLTETEHLSSSSDSFLSLLFHSEIPEIWALIFGSLWYSEFDVFVVVQLWCVWRRFCSQSLFWASELLLSWKPSSADSLLAAGHSSLLLIQLKRSTGWSQINLCRHWSCSSAGDEHRG